MKLYDWRRQVTGWLVFLLCCLPGVGWAGEYQSTLLVQTGMLRESDLIVRIVADLESSKICLTFYVRTVGTSPAMTCYNAESGFRSRLNQVGFFKEDKLIVRKVRDEENGVSCLVTYVSAQGTAPAIDCYKGKSVTRETLTRNEHLREGDLDVHRILDPESNKTCLVAYVSTGGISPSLVCYDSLDASQGGLVQTSWMREGDLIVRKVLDQANNESCLIGYVSTEGTSPHIFCSSSAGGSLPTVETELPPPAEGTDETPFYWK